MTAIRLECNISKTARDRDSVPKDHQKETAYGASNGHVTDDVTWPRKVREAVRSAIPETAWLLVFFAVAVPASRTAPLAYQEADK